MSRTRVYRQETISVMERFFEALDLLVASKRIRGIQTYCKEFGIDKRHLYAQKKDLNKGFFEVYWILPMIQSLGVSSEWLLFGKGSMFKKNRKNADVITEQLQKGEA